MNIMSLYNMFVRRNMLFGFRKGILLKDNSKIKVEYEENIYYGIVF